MISAVMPTYSRAEVAFERGEGPYLFDAAGRRWLDFASGVAVTALGHAHPRLVAALKDQAGKLWHCSNLYRISGQERLAERLCALSFAETAFFCNSGAEALEGCIKTARKHFDTIGQPDRYRIITCEGAFHGRTLATLAAGGQPKHLAGFEPVVDGFDQVAWGDVEAVGAAIGPHTAAILVEPVQGEGGIRPAPEGYLAALRALADQHGLLLIFDEVQTGMGRTGHLFAHQADGVTPDLMALAKGLGGGFPIGAFLATEAAAAGMVAGSHGSTFGGNPLAMAVANAVLDEVTAPGFLERVCDVAAALHQRLGGLAAAHPSLLEGVRGRGLMVGLKARGEGGNARLGQACMAEGLLGVPAGDNVLRLLPPLIIDQSHVDEALAALDRACAALEDGNGAS